MSNQVQTRHLDFIFIGAGFAQLTCAAILQRLGHNTLIIEKSGAVGGAWQSLEIHGNKIECAPHILANARLLENCLEDLQINLNSMTPKPLSRVDLFGMKLVMPLSRAHSLFNLTGKISLRKLAFLPILTIRLFNRFFREFAGRFRKKRKTLLNNNNKSWKFFQKGTAAAVSRIEEIYNEYGGALILNEEVIEIELGVSKSVTIKTHDNKYNAQVVVVTDKSLPDKVCLNEEKHYLKSTERVSKSYVYMIESDVDLDGQYFQDETTTRKIEAVYFQKVPSGQNLTYAVVRAASYVDTENDIFLASDIEKHMKTIFPKIGNCKFITVWKYNYSVKTIKNDFSHHQLVIANDETLGGLFEQMHNLCISQS